MDAKAQILDMLKEGKISTEDALKLLEALEGKKEEKEKEKSSLFKESDAQWLRLRSIDKYGDILVNMAFPLSIFTFGFKFMSQFSPEITSSGISEEELDHIFEAVKNGIKGKILDVNLEDGSRIEIVIE